LGEDVTRRLFELLPLSRPNADDDSLTGERAQFMGDEGRTFQEAGRSRIATRESGSESVAGYSYQRRTRSYTFTKTEALVGQFQHQLELQTTACLLEDRG
ncbi:hypothetical protein, partial [Pyrinomonas sp.]|uniref:hypothetical protein n=1 Tax=Pyrinomonas sp. TaxID=2080306 RepID=UPI00331F751D